tara:strand:- start:2485 stop:2847 length:363 start_codon:yes stop_codon:yes gene_type:complete
MLLPGENYSERLMFTLQGYRETWVDGRAATLYGEAFAALSEANELSKADKEQINNMKTGEDVIDLALDIFDAGRKGLRFSKAAAPLILADGPLPFGDVIFVIALGLDFALAAYEVVVRDD